jgi:hypothetical protein
MTDSNRNKKYSDDAILQRILIFFVVCVLTFLFVKIMYF